MSQITFNEDREFLKKIDPREKVPEKGLEGWFHKHSPYGPKTNKLILIFTATTIFIIAAFFFLASIYNQNKITEQRTNSFIERSQNTNSR